MCKSSYVIDSLQSTPNLQKHQQLYGESSALQDIFNVELPATFRWIFGPRQTAPWRSAEFAVLNAWSILLDLELNTDKFAPHNSFTKDSRRIFQAAARGHADWKLIWSFLRCEKYVTEQHVPAPERRFTSTIGVDARDEHSTRMEARRPPSPDELIQTARYRRFSADMGYRHNAPFPQDDDLDDEDIRVRIPALKKSGKYSRTLWKSELRNLHAGLPVDFDPCKYFREKRDELLQDTRIKADLEDFRIKSNVTIGMREWLWNQEVCLAVAAVTLAITKQQRSPEQGFSFLHYDLVQLCMADRDHTDQFRDGTIRPGCPMLLPLCIHQHNVLLIIRLNNGQPEFSIMDSKSQYLTAEHRQEIHDWACRIARYTMWWRGLYSQEDFEEIRPSCTVWLPLHTNQLTMNAHTTLYSMLGP